MSEEQVIEGPEYGTAGLTSAIQLVDLTSFPVFTPVQSTAVGPSPPQWAGPAKFPARQAIRVPVRGAHFEEAVRDSLRDNAEILRELAKY